jgi:hypothetical protein
VDTGGGTAVTGGGTSVVDDAVVVEDPLPIWAVVEHAEILSKTQVIIETNILRSARNGETSLFRRDRKQVPAHDDKSTVIGSYIHEDVRDVYAPRLTPSRLS